MPSMYYMTKLEFIYSDSRTFNTAICSLTPKSHVERIKSTLKHINKLTDNQVFENAKVTIIVHNDPNFKCDFTNKKSLLHTENLIHANTETSVFSIYYTKTKKQNQLIAVLYLPSFVINNCSFTKA